MAAKSAAIRMAMASTLQKNRFLEALIDNIKQEQERIIAILCKIQ
jgi:gamma-glutamyl phosphate reductase